MDIQGFEFLFSNSRTMSMKQSRPILNFVRTLAGTLVPDCNNFKEQLQHKNNTLSIILLCYEQQTVYLIDEKAHYSSLGGQKKNPIDTLLSIVFLSSSAAIMT
jgi:hypothetical protein